MQFDRFTIALLILRDDAPKLDKEAAATLQDAHLAYLAGLHEAGHLPGGAVAFSPTRFPRSIAEAQGG